MNVLRVLFVEIPEDGFLVAAPTVIGPEDIE